MNFRVRQSSPRVIAFLVTCGISLAVVLTYLTVAPVAHSMAASFAVNDTADSVDATPGDGTCADSLDRCTLRAAIMEANASVGADTILLPAGTYTLTLGPNDDEEGFDGARQDIGDLDVLSGDLTITGDGAATTIIDGAGIDRIIEVNDFAGPGVAVNLTISGVTLRNGNTHASPSGYFPPGGAIQFDGFDLSGPSSKRLTLNNCVVSSNRSDAQGGGISVIFGALTINNTQISSNESTHATGGGVAYDGGSAAAAGRTLEVTNSTFSSNRAPDALFGDGGGLEFDGNTISTIENNTFSNNTAGTNGGGISAGAPSAANSKTIKKNKFEGNLAKDGGGVFNRNGTTTFELNLIVGNSATGEDSFSGFREATPTAPGTITTLVNNWWGCNDGPSMDPCDRAAPDTGAAFAANTWLKLTHTATPNSIPTNGSASLQADFFTPNSGAPVPAADLVVLEGRPIVFNNAFLGTISGAGTQIIGGKANATFNAGATAGNGSANATVDSQTETANITITQTGQELSAVGPASVWIGLKNSDDVGTKFDLLAEALKNGVVVGSGQLNDVPGGSSGFNNAVERVIAMALTGGPVSFQSGDTLGFRLSVRIAASSGHVSGTARLWYNDAAADSKFTATIGGVTSDYFLRDGFVLATTAGPGPKKTSDVAVNRNQGGNPFKPFGTWTKTF